MNICRMLKLGRLSGRKMQATHFRVLIIDQYTVPFFGGGLSAVEEMYFVVTLVSTRFISRTPNRRHGTTYVYAAAL